MRKLFIILASAALLFSGVDTVSAQSQEGHKCKVLLAGDSTCAPRKEKDRPKWGWGEKLSQFLDGNEVRNHAMGGRSTKSFIEEGRWDKLMGEVEKGDVVLIQFGHNDQKEGKPYYADAWGAYSENLTRFINEVKAKEAVPVILTSMSRRHFKDGVLRHTHKDYPAAAKKVAADNGVVMLDIEELTWQWLTALGEEESAKRFFVCVDGKDNTHLVEQGAQEVAEIIAKALKTCGDPYLEALVK